MITIPFIEKKKLRLQILPQVTGWISGRAEETKSKFFVLEFCCFGFFLICMNLKLDTIPCI